MLNKSAMRRFISPAVEVPNVFYTPRTWPQLLRRNKAADCNRDKWDCGTQIGPSFKLNHTPLFCKQRSALCLRNNVVVEWLARVGRPEFQESAWRQVLGSNGSHCCSIMEHQITLRQKRLQVIVGKHCCATTLWDHMWCGVNKAKQSAFSVS
jgi:hypothetical protein